VYAPAHLLPRRRCLRRLRGPHRYNNADWQADHVLPLFMAFGDPPFWDPENLQILCTDPCHKIKTADDRAKYSFVAGGREKRKRNRPARAG
jgi:5-methylcytosine-specific restriction endonuclease McrA